MPEKRLSVSPANPGSPPGLAHGRVVIEVEVHKEPTNEGEPWTPPSAREVAAFVQELCAGADTDDGWYVGMVTAYQSDDSHALLQRSDDGAQASESVLPTSTTNTIDVSECPDCGAKGRYDGRVLVGGRGIYTCPSCGGVWQNAEEKPSTKGVPITQPVTSAQPEQHDDPEGPPA